MTLPARVARSAGGGCLNHRPFFMPTGYPSNNVEADSAPSAPSILIVEDEALVAADIEARLERMGYRVAGQAQTSEEAIQQTVEHRPDLILMDINLGRGGDGVATAQALRPHRDVPVVFLTANSDPATVERATRAGPFGYILKPFKDREIEIAIQLALAKHEMEHRLRLSERRFIATVSGLADGVIAADPAGKVTFLNPAAERLTGWPLAEAVGRELREVFPALHPETRETDTAFFSAFLHVCNSEAVIREAVLRARAGAESFIEYRAAYLYDDRRRFSGAVISITDVTERRQAGERLAHSQRELQKAHEHLLHKHEELQGFYHSVSHEVKTPLTSPREFVSLVLEGLAGPVTETQQEYLSIAQESCDQMRTYINDMLDVTRLDTGKVHVEFQPASLGALAQRFVTRFAPAAARKGVALECVVAPNLPLLPLDESRIGQVLTNLLSNALKFTPEAGRITVSVTAAARGCLELAVADTGRGIAPEHHDRIFDRLYQVEREDASSREGLGLGLHICRELTRLHGGTIRVESKVGTGSAFIVSLPIAGSVQVSVLVVEDEAAMRQALQCLLQRANFTVTAVESGAEALERWSEAKPDVVLTDLQMPHMDGAALLREIRTRGILVPVVVHTGFPESEVMARAMEFSPFTLLSKPCDAAMLFKTLRTLARPS